PRPSVRVGRPASEEVGGRRGGGAPPEGGRGVESGGEGWAYPGPPRRGRAGRPPPHSLRHGLGPASSAVRRTASPRRVIVTPWRQLPRALRSRLALRAGDRPGSCWSGVVQVIGLGVPAGRQIGSQHGG